MRYIIPGYFDELNLDTLILDLNGTIAIDGVLISGVKEKISELVLGGWNIILCSGDTQGTAALIAKEIGATLYITHNQEDKKNLSQMIDATHAVMIGNGLIDIELMKLCALSIAVIQQEGCHRDIIATSTISTNSILDALDILILPKRLIATLRK